MDAHCVDRPLAVVDCCDPSTTTAFVVALLERGLEVHYSRVPGEDGPDVDDPAYDLLATCWRRVTPVDVATTGTARSRDALLASIRETGRPLAAAVVSAPVEWGPIVHVMDCAGGGHLLVTSTHDDLRGARAGVRGAGRSSVTVIRASRWRSRLVVGRRPRRNTDLLPPEEIESARRAVSGMLAGRAMVSVLRSYDR